MLQQSISQTSALALFRRCIRCIQAMPDPNQRESYRIYVRDAFHRRKGMQSNSREAIVAYRDGIDQVETMEYYQSMKMKLLKHDDVKPRISSSVSLTNIEHDDAGRSETSNSFVRGKSSSLNKNISQWLSYRLPHLAQDDLEKYSRRLIEDGFDTVEFIENELLADDLDFMKKAHRRVLERYIKDKNA
jgi:hypothetical protein